MGLSRLFSFVEYHTSMALTGSDGAPISLGIGQMNRSYSDLTTTSDEEGRGCFSLEALTRSIRAKIFTPESMEYNSAELALLTAEDEQALIKPATPVVNLEAAEELPQSASAPITQTEVETRRFKGALYEKGADGQWHLKQAQMELAVSQDDSCVQPDTSQPESVAFESAEMAVPAAEDEQMPVFTQAEMAASQDAGDSLADVSLLGSLADEHAELVAISAEEEQMPVVSTGAAEETQQCDSAPMAQIADVGPRRYKGALYEKGSDGQWHLLQTQTCDAAPEQAKSFGRSIWAKFLTSAETPIFMQLGLSANRDDAGIQTEVSQPESMACDSVELVSLNAEEEKTPVLAQAEMAVNQNDGDSLPEASQPESMACDAVELVSLNAEEEKTPVLAQAEMAVNRDDVAIPLEASHPESSACVSTEIVAFTAEAEQTPVITPMEAVAEENLQNASAPIIQAEAELRRYRGALYEKGADGQWHLKQTQFEMAARVNDGASQPENVAYECADSDPSVVLTAETEQQPVFAKMELVAKREDERGLPGEILPESLATDPSGPVSNCDLPAQASADAATRTFKVLTYEKGADGQWRLQQSQTTVVNVQAPVTPWIAPPAAAQDAALTQAELQVEPEKSETAEPIRARKSTSQSKTIFMRKPRAKATAMPSMMTSTKGLASGSVYSNL